MQEGSERGTGNAVMESWAEKTPSKIWTGFCASRALAKEPGPLDYFTRLFDIGHAIDPVRLKLCNSHPAR
jgi:hypothetical protein